MTLAQAMPLWFYQHVPWAVFLFCFGACVGSFLNVVVYRLPAGISVISPPSRCPTCGARLTWRENLPILGWVLLRGRCRFCKAGISPQYMVIELSMALLFLGLYVLLYVIHPSTPWWGEIGGMWWYNNGIHRTYPAFIALAFLFVGLLGMTIIDARSFIIPIQIPLFVTIIALIAFPVQAVFNLSSAKPPSWPQHVTNGQWADLAVGGMLGVLVSMILLRTRVLRMSFADYGDYLAPDSGDQPLPTDRATAFEVLFLIPMVIGLIAAGFFTLVGAVITASLAAAIVAVGMKLAGYKFDPPMTDSANQVLAPEYPHARREMMVELLYLLPPMLGMFGGYIVGGWLAGPSTPVFVQAVGGTMFGYLAGAGLVWGVRILGTLLFGREAMGLGDVHLMGAVGAVLGWQDAVVAFFLASFFGLLWFIMSILLGRMFSPRGLRRELPFGPHLALAALAVFLCRPEISSILARVLPMLPVQLVDRQLWP